MDKLRHWFWTRLNFLLRHAGMLLAPPPPMTACVVTVRPDRRRYRIDNEGFTLIEIMMTLVIAGVLTAVALPMFQNASKSYRLSSAVLAVTGAIQTTRYQAIMHGCPYTLSIDPTSRTYQVQSEPPGASSFSNVGTAVPWATSGAITLSPSTTFQFSPGGIIKVQSGSSVLTVSNGISTETITVSEVGNVSVSP